MVKIKVRDKVGGKVKVKAKKIKVRVASCCVVL